MTTNQTIDGVPRRTIEWAFECLETCQDQAFQSCECEQCEQCGKMPDECIGTECSNNCQCSTCEHCSNELAMTGLRNLLDKPSAQSIRSPVLLVELVENKIYGGMHIVKWHNPGGLKQGPHRLYAERPAPVSVVLPVRLTDNYGESDQVIYAQSYNACLDDLERLNPRAKPHNPIPWHYDQFHNKVVSVDHLEGWNVALDKGGSE